SAAASINRSAWRTEPSWLLPISAMTSAGCPGPSSLPAMCTGFTVAPALAWIPVSVRLAIVGMGGRGLKLVAHLVDQPEWDVVGVADRSAVAYARLQAELYDRRVHMVREAGDLLRLDPEVILVATTAAGHAPVVQALFDAGYEGALFVEKPLAASVAQGRELERLLDGRPRVAVGFQRRGSAMYAEAV